MSIKKGDLVVIKDGSYAVRVDKYERSTHIGLCRDVFEVIRTTDNDLKSFLGTVEHDIFIKNTVNGAIYLHSSSSVVLSPEPTKEMTLPEIIKELGYEVKIVK